MDNSWLFGVLGVVSTLCAIVFGYTSYRRDQKKENEAEGSLISDIGYIKAGIDDLKKQQARTEERYIEVVSRLTAVEASARQAHKRIDDHIKDTRDACVP